MPIDTKPAPYLPDRQEMRDHVFRALSRYWPDGDRPLRRLPLKASEPAPAIDTPLRLKSVQMPKWAMSCAVDGELLVPKEAFLATRSSTNDQWESVDWILATFLLLEGWHERLWEYQHGPIHSYSFRLKGWDERAWQRAWVNRIGLFLRLWVEREEGLEAKHLLGALPLVDLRMTHDVDAVSKTFPIRLKQSAFNFFNTFWGLRRSQPKVAKKCLRQGIKFLTSRDEWWLFDRILADEKSANIVATWHFYGDQRPGTLKRWVFDPGYDIRASAQRKLLQQLINAGHEIGLHPGFDNWQHGSDITTSREVLEHAAGCEVKECRQHWLRFSWSDTWRAQQKAGLARDTTLMFNDRAGFRNSSALAWHPWNTKEDSAHQLKALSTVFMDSHFYDYQPMTRHQRNQSIHHWLGECQAVCGQNAVLWHPHTLSADYGWTDGFYDTLSTIKGINV